MKKTVTSKLYLLPLTGKIDPDRYSDVIKYEKHPCIFVIAWLWHRFLSN
jgi:hypothetical protein